MMCFLAFSCTHLLDALLVSMGLGTSCLTTEHRAFDMVIVLGFECSVEAVVLFIFYIRHVFGIS